MSARHQIPPLLDAYIRLPQETALLLLTGTVDAAPHWLTVRYLSRFLGHTGRTPRVHSNGDDATPDADDEELDVAVVLVSWLRDFEYWKSEARRGAGIDLSRLAAEKRFAFVHGLSSLAGASSSGPQGQPAYLSRAVPSASDLTAARRSVPHRGTLPTRGPATTTPSLTLANTLAASESSSRVLQSGIRTPLPPALATAEQAIEEAIGSLRSSKPVFLVLDSPTFLLATIPGLTPTALSSFILTLRAQVHSTLAVVEADSPFLAAAAPDAFLSGNDYMKTAQDSVTGKCITPLENDHAALLSILGHQAAWVIGVKGLDTGVARDVSGVVSVRRGGAWHDTSHDGSEDGTASASSTSGKDAGQSEVLYRVGLDGGVKVFERGAGDIG